MPINDTKYIEKIKIPTADTPAGESLLVRDSTAVHEVKTINGDSITSSGNVSLPNTPITTKEVDNLFK